MTFLRILCLTLALFSSAQAQSPVLPGPGLPVAAASYVGPGDITSGAVFFGSCYRAYNAAYANGTNPLCDLVATTGGATVCTLRVATTGKVDLAASYCAGTTPAAACAAASGGACKVTRLYNQISSNHANQGTLASMPLLTFNPSGVGSGTVAMTFAGGSEGLLTGVVTQAQPLLFSSVSVRTGGTGSFTQMIGGDANPPGLLYTNTANSVTLYAGSTPSTTASDSTWHAINGLVNAASSQLWIDGTGTGAISAGASDFTGSFGVQVGNFSGTALAGSIGEVILWNGDKSASVAALTSNARSSANGYNF